jgi:hypothetical protein
MKAYGGITFKLRPLYSSGKEPPVPIPTKLVVPKSLSGCSGETINLLTLPGIELLFNVRLASSLITIPTRVGCNQAYINHTMLQHGGSRTSLFCITHRQTDRQMRGQHHSPLPSDKRSSQYPLRTGNRWREATTFAANSNIDGQVAPTEASCTYMRV